VYLPFISHWHSLYYQSKVKKNKLLAKITKPLLKLKIRVFLGIAKLIQYVIIAKKREKQATTGN
jgi:hypothetical protein